MPAIEARELVRQYAPGRGVCGIDFAVEPGECYALLGRNGSGKSTLAALLVGLQRPDGGELTVLGEPVGRGSRRHLARCGVALDRAVHRDVLTGRQNAHFVTRASGMQPQKIGPRLDELFELAGLTAQADEPVARWSFGMRRKLAIVEALATDPPLLVLDEPTAGVDAQFQLALTQQIRRRCGEGKTTWLASNEPDWVAAVASRVAFIEAGRILAEGTVEGLLADLQDAQEVRIALARVEPVERPAVGGLRSFAQNGERLTAVLDDEPALLGRLIDALFAAGHELRSVEVRRASLRDAFLARTGKAVDE